MDQARRTLNFVIVPTVAVALSWSAMEAHASSPQQIAITSVGTVGVELSAEAQSPSSTRSVMIITSKRSSSTPAIGRVPLRFVLISTTSVVSFAVSVAAAAATFAPAHAAQAADVSLVAMLSATAFGAWAASIAQKMA